MEAVDGDHTFIANGCRGLKIEPMAKDEVKNSNESEYEHELVSRIQDGDKEAFGELVGRYQKKIFIFAYGFFPNRDDAMEIVQETFMRIFAKIGSYHPQQPFSGWVFRLTHNICIDTYRKFAKKNALENSIADVAEKQLIVLGNSHQELESRQMSAAIERASESLSVKQKSVFILKYRQGMKLQQVAEIMNVSLGTVKTLHHRALQKIRKEVGSDARGEYGTVS